MNLSKARIFFILINLWFLFSGFIYANLFFHSGDRYPVNIFSSYFFLIVLPLIFFILGFIANIKKKDGLFRYFEKIIKVIFKFFNFLSANMTTPFLKSEFYLNGILFSFGGLLALCLKILLTDIYFGWFFPISFSPGFVQFGVDCFIWPWNWIWEGASPQIELISETQFFKLNSDFYFEKIKMTRELSGIGDWRAFFIASYLFYGITPRLILWGINLKQTRKIN